MLAKFMNMVMERGKKSVAETIVYGAIDRIAERTSRPADQALQVLASALDNVKPAVEVKSRRVGGATYQVPVEVRANRRQTLAMRWVIEAARSRSEKSMAMRLAHELLEAAGDPPAVGVGLGEDEFFELLARRDSRYPDLLKAFLTKAQALVRP
jgi:small subunit ribosomal protein S7